MAAVALEKGSDSRSRPVRRTRPRSCSARRPTRRRRSSRPATGGRVAPEWLMSVIACVAGLAVFVAAWAVARQVRRPHSRPAHRGRGGGEDLRRPVLQQGAERPGHRLERAVVAQARRHRLRPGGAGRHPARLHHRALPLRSPAWRRRSSRCSSRCRRSPGCRSGCWCSRRPTRRRSGSSSSAACGR